MKLTYDPDCNIAYIRLREKTDEVETLRLRDELNVDVGSDGKVYGFELLNANEQLRADDASGLTVVNEASGETSRIRLAV